MYATNNLSLTTPHFSQITKHHTSIRQYKVSKQVTPMPQHPTKQVTPPTNPPIHKITPKASQTADLNCLNFKLAVTPPK